MPNLKQFISGHNKKILKKNEPKKAEKVCNCRGGVKNCPVEGQCRKQEVIYEVEVSADQKENKSYLGSTATEFKDRYGNHKSDCKLEHRRHATKLSGYVWELKDMNVRPVLKYRIKETAQAFSPVTDKGPFTNDVMLFEAFPDPHLPPCHAMSLFGYPPPYPQIMTSF